MVIKAFPCEWVEWKDKIATPKASTGMDLRDYFAAQVINGMCSQKYGPASYDIAVDVAYKVADLMMKAREQ